MTGVENVLTTTTTSRDTPSNHYQDISVRRVMAELAGDEAWPEVTPTEPGDADLLDFGTGRTRIGCREPTASEAAACSRSASRTRRGSCSAPRSCRSTTRPDHDPPGRGASGTTWRASAHLSVEAFWQMSKVVEVRYDRFLALGPGRADPLGEEREQRDRRGGVPARLTLVNPEEATGGETLLMGTISLDQYLATGEVLPGGGVLNMAWHWASFGRPFELLTRVGSEDGG